jgi:hypothetical protein
MNFIAKPGCDLLVAGDPGNHEARRLVSPKNPKHLLGIKLCCTITHIECLQQRIA